ncbi:helix-turn-helix domain-containing protein [Lactiplantibacillus plantarum]|nr:helix-turn-helix domain-containing protein [Lactiplantibacillus plantarum]MEA5158890.1 helix-turn-helix domain-containing protein [Lactiplantibacillus plantarum]
MSKYSSELKSQIVSEYLAGNPTAELSNNYHVSKKRINKWVHLFRMNGSQALKRRRPYEQLDLKRAHQQLFFELAYTDSVLDPASQEAERRNYPMTLTHQYPGLSDFATYVHRGVAIRLDFQS